MFNKKLNQRIYLLMNMVDSLSAKITEIDAKLWALTNDSKNIQDELKMILDKNSILHKTNQSLTTQVNEMTKYFTASSVDSHYVLSDIEYLTRKLHEAKVIDASELGFDDDDYCPLEQVEQNAQESPKQEEVGNEQPKMEFEGGEAIIEQPKLQDNEVDADLIKQVAKETKQRMVVRKKDREFFRMAFYRKLPHRFHFLSAVGIGANMGLSRYNVEKLLNDDIGASYYEEKSPKIYIMVKQLPQE